MADEYIVRGGESYGGVNPRSVFRRFFLEDYLAHGPLIRVFTVQYKFERALLANSPSTYRQIL